MATAQSGSNNGSKVFGPILGLAAIIAGIFAMMRPLIQRVDFLERQLDNAIAAMREDDVREREDAAKMSATREKFVEVETQFSDLEKRISDQEAWLDWWHKNMPKVTACHEQRLKYLENMAGCNAPKEGD